VPRNVKVNVPDFDGGHDPDAFADWLHQKGLDHLEDHFEFYGMTVTHKVRFAKMVHGDIILLLVILLLRVNMKCVCVFVRERERERERDPTYCHEMFSFFCRL